MKKLRWIAIIPFLAIFLPFIYRPTRILYPQLFGLVCPNSTLCLEDEQKLDEAKQLLERNIYKIETRISAISYQPKFVFCSTKNCWHGFGFDRPAAMTMGKWGTIVSPRGWKDYYIQHELIHHWQADKISTIKMLLASPWLIEGMAYYLSDDPRTLLEPFQSYRLQFEHWYETIDRDDLPAALRKEILKKVTLK